MGQQPAQNFFVSLPKPKEWYLPVKVLVTMIVIVISLGMFFALGQIVVHDIIPTFQQKQSHSEENSGMDEETLMRGDLFAADMPEKRPELFYKTDEFIFALKFTHIHIFGMSAIFILMGAIVVFLDLRVKTKAWLIILPFIGVVVDLASVWLKLFVHPVFFWMHVPGGVLFGTVFVSVSFVSVWQIWAWKD